MARKRKAFLSYHNLIQFIPETHKKDILTKEAKGDGRTTEVGTVLTGHEVKSFYESLVNNEKCQKASTTSVIDIHKKNQSRPTTSYCVAGTAKTQKNKDCGQTLSSDATSTPSPSKYNFSSSFSDPSKRKYFKLLQCSQLGHETPLKELLDDGLDVNFKDFYGWTPLMCAAKEGHVDVMKILIIYGADKLLCNSSGDTALTLALNAGHSTAVDILKSYDGTSVTETTDAQLEHSSSGVFHCKVCKRDFSQRESSSHLTSTVHLFNSGHHSKGPAFFIPNNNRGFQMMLRSGWNAESGLGPKGKGFKYPIKTVLKQDRAGLGGEDVKRKKAKVTHFGCGDKEAVAYVKGRSTRQLSVKTISRQAAKLKEKRERRWEQNLRFEMS